VIVDSETSLKSITKRQKRSINSYDGKGHVEGVSEQLFSVEYARIPVTSVLDYCN